MSYNTDIMIGYGIVVREEEFISAVNIKYSTDEFPIDIDTADDAVDIIDENYKCDLLELFTFYANYGDNAEDTDGEDDDDPEKDDGLNEDDGYEYYDNDGNVINYKNENVGKHKYGVLILLNTTQMDIQDCNATTVILPQKFIRNLHESNKYDDKFQQLCEYFEFINKQPGVCVQARANKY